MKTIFVAFLSIFTSVAYAQQPITNSHCSASEKNIFSCSTDKKVISICATSTGDLQYRFGAITKPEMVFPNIPKQNNLISRGNTMFSGGGSSFVRFKNGKIAYVVYSALSGKYGEWAGVAVEKDEKVIANIKCKNVSKDELEGHYVQFLKEDPNHDMFDLPVR